MRKKFLGTFVFAVCLLAFSKLAFGHAILTSSTPAIHGTVHGPQIDIDLKFNSRVDGTRSSLSMVMPGGDVKPLSPVKQAGPNELTSQAQLPPGKYILRWQALAVDGHITRGEIPFTVE